MYTYHMNNMIKRQADIVNERDWSIVSLARGITGKAIRKPIS